MKRKKLAYLFTIFFSLISFVLWLFYFMPDWKNLKNHPGNNSLNLIKNSFKKETKKNNLDYSSLVKKISQIVKGNQMQKIKIKSTNQRGRIIVEAQEIYLAENNLIIVFTVKNTNDFDVSLPETIYLISEENQIFTAEIKTDDLIYLPLKRQIKQLEQINGAIVFPGLVNQGFDFSSQNLKVFFEGIKNNTCLEKECPQFNLLLDIKPET